MSTSLPALRLRLRRTWMVTFKLAAAFAAAHLNADSTADFDSTAQKELPLPRWSESELRAFRESSGFFNESLLPSTGQPMIDASELLRLDQFPAGLSDLPSRLRPEEMNLFLPEGLLGPRSMPLPQDSALMPTPLPALEEVTHEFMAVCAATPPGEFLLDPEMLVPEMQSQAISKFLEFHARDARIRLHVIVLPKQKKLAETSQVDHVAVGSLLARESCLLVYPLSEPWRAQLFLSRSVHSQVSEAFLHETLQTCVHSALQSSDSYDQLQRYMVELSTRLFWLQKALGNRAGAAKPGEHHLTAVSTTVKPSKSFDFAPWLTTASILLALAGLWVVAWLLFRNWQHRRSKSVWILPEPETVPRLGGAFTGGGGGMIRY